MKSFQQLTSRGRIQRLKQLALRGLEVHYGIRAQRAKILAQTDNLVMRIVAENGQIYVLRLYFKGDEGGYMTVQSDAELQSEINFLHALTEAGFIVPAPIANQQGAWLTSYTDTTLAPDAWHIALFSWVHGRFYDETLTPKHLYRLGKLQAQLHDFSTNYTPPEGFQRWSWDVERFMGSDSVYSEQGLSAYFEDADLVRQLLPARERIASFMRALPRDKQHYGIVHSDLHQWNYLFQREDVATIDWGDMGWGHYMFDIGSTLYYVRRRDDFLELREALLEGYASVRPLPADVMYQMDMFMHLRYIDLLSWVLSSDALRAEYGNTPMMQGWCDALVAFGQA
jgi:Ser/Thr protein kinase RdoA (MazF antagonist)